MYKLIIKTYLNPKYMLPCRAGSMIGEIYPNGLVYPCEILDKKYFSLKGWYIGKKLLSAWKTKKRTGKEKKERGKETA